MVAPNYAFGKLLKALAKQDTFMDYLLDKYLKNDSLHTDHNGTRITLAEAACRLLLVIMPGLDAVGILSPNVRLIIL